MTKLSKANTYAIQWLNSQNKQPIEIADELKLKIDQVNLVLEKSILNMEKNNNIQTTKSPASRSHDLMITKTSGKKTNSVAIMTGEASMANDALKNQIPKNNQLRNTDRYIFRPKNK